MTNFTTIRFSGSFAKALFIGVIMLSWSLVSNGQKTSIANGNWSDDAIWSPYGAPVENSEVIINHTIALNVTPPDMKKIKVNAGGSLIGTSNSLTIKSSNGNYFTDYGYVKISSIAINNNATITVDGKLILTGSLTLTNKGLKGSGYVSATDYNTGSQKVFGRTPIDGEIICGRNWDGSVNTIWTSVGNWTKDGASTSVPDASSYVSIHSATNQPVISSAVTVKELVINGGTTNLKVNAGSSLTVTDTTQILSASGLKLLSPSASGAPGSFITSYVSGSGSALAERYISGYSTYPQGQQADHGWHTISSPVDAQAFTSGNFAPGPNDDLYLWDETTDIWINIKSTPSAFGTQFGVGKGYLCAYQNSTPVKQFTGSLNGNSNLDITGLTKSTTNQMHSGWNLVGNPFPSALNWNISDAAWNKVNIDNIAKIWNEANASYTDINTNGTIPAMQGFMVHVNNIAGGSFTIPKSEKKHSTQAFYKSTEVNRLVLVASDPVTATAQESVITFNDGATKGYDSDLDSYFASGYAPEFYSIPEGDEMLSTNTLPAFDGSASVVMGFKKRDGMTYTIEASGVETFTPGIIITLEDTKENATQCLNENPVYAFTSAAGDDPARFIIHFDSPVTTGNSTAGIPLTVYSAGSVIYIATPANSGTYQVTVSDMTGKTVYTGTVSQAIRTSIPMEVSTGLYIVSVRNGESSLVKKIMINN
jgi:hypothetical protein